MMLFLSLNIGKTSISRISLIKKMDFQEDHQEDKVSKVSNKGICSLIPSANHPSFKCSGEYLNFIVPATDEGKWPKGLTWTILEDAKDFQGIMGRVYIETGPKDIEPSCKSFSKVLCLEGNYILYVNSEDNSVDNKENYYVDVCSSDNRIKVGEALDFNANLFMCSEPNFEKTIPKQVEFAIKEPELSLSYFSNAQDYTEQPSFLPTFEPSNSPIFTDENSIMPSETPTMEPTFTPTLKHNPFPSWKPSKEPTYSPTDEPTHHPTFEPTKHPSFHPSHMPTEMPTFEPTKRPSMQPSREPVYNPTLHPTFEPTNKLVNLNFDSDYEIDVGHGKILEIKFRDKPVD
jgi:hypothetical protein